VGHPVCTAVVGKDVPTAEHRLNAVVRAQIEAAYRTDNMSLLFFRAPFSYWEQVKRAKNLPPSTLEVETPPMVLPVTQKIKVGVPVWRAELQAA
jgi:hypothetical protein